MLNDGLIPNSEHGDAWTLALSLSRSVSGFKNDHFGLYWVGEMIRRFSLKQPILTSRSKTLPGWLFILARQAKPKEVRFVHAERSINAFFAEHGSHWGVVTNHIHQESQSVLTYQITRILSPEESLEAILPGYKETKAYQQYAADLEEYQNAHRHILTAAEFRAFLARA